MKYYKQTIFDYSGNELYTIERERSAIDHWREPCSEKMAEACTLIFNAEFLYNRHPSISYLNNKQAIEMLLKHVSNAWEMVKNEESKPVLVVNGRREDPNDPLYGTKP
jgi:hypothetical protein